MTTARSGAASMPSMSTSSPFRQLPEVHDAHPPDITFGRAMEWVWVLFAAIWGRVMIIGFWIFSDLLGDAYDSWVLPAVGFLIAPWATMGYAIAWGVSSSEVTGAEWLFVAGGLLIDVLTLVGARALLKPS